MVNEALLRQVTQRVMEKLNEYVAGRVPIGVSNRHVHVTQEDLEVLFGQGYQLTKKSDLKQPGQYACNETVTVRGPKGEFTGVRILGPVRQKSQIEIAKTDSFRLGVRAPIRESGDLDGTPGLSMIGPQGSVTLPQGAIIALRHIHMRPDQAEALGLKDKDIVEVETFGERKGVLGDVLIRVSEAFSLEMHVDVDEANACALNNNDYVMIKRKQPV